MPPSLIERQVLRARNGLAYLAGTNKPQLGQTPKDVVWRRDKAELWRYRREDAPVSVAPPILIVHSLVSKSYVLDLMPNNSMIRFLLGEGFDVFLLDWGVADAVEAQNTLEDYVDDYIPEAVEATLVEGGADELNLIGYCFGGVLTLLLMAGHPELPIRSLVTLATPADYDKMGFMSQMFASGRLDPEDVIGETGLVAASRMDEGFQSLKPTDQVVQQVNLFQNLWNDEFVEGFLAMNQWARDQVPFPGAAFRQTVQILIRENALMKGVIPFGRGEVRLKDITVPYLNVFAEQDGIVPASSSEPITKLVGSDDASDLRLQSGHVGFVAGRQAAKVARPKIADWIRRHSDEV
ncbi:MAG: poly[(R)-3-hydroxyalkanoate] polymerase subunit PhaC [Solirubrobacteraceae bacterium]|nr:poly[(R)-3-hydroxyalkanoate] polymerase subunit PhaC [Solirubrobacteraceae bacterium]